jgi:hypothetical protein
VDPNAGLLLLAAAAHEVPPPAAPDVLKLGPACRLCVFPAAAEHGEEVAVVALLLM